MLSVDAVEASDVGGSSISLVSLQAQSVRLVYLSAQSFCDSLQLQFKLIFILAVNISSCVVVLSEVRGHW